MIVLFFIFAAICVSSVITIIVLACSGKKDKKDYYDFI